MTKLRITPVMAKKKENANCGLE